MIAATPRLFSAVATNLTRALCTMVGPKGPQKMNTAIRTNATKAASVIKIISISPPCRQPRPAPPCPPHGIRLRSSYRRGRRHRTWLAVDQLQRRPALRRGGLLDQED